MAKVTWLGEDEGPDVPGPSFTTWAGIRFDKGKAVEVADEDMIKRAKRSRFFEVDEELPKKAPEDWPVVSLANVKRGPGRPPKVRDDDEDAH